MKKTIRLICDILKMELLFWMWIDQVSLSIMHAWIIRWKRLFFRCLATNLSPWSQNFRTKFDTHLIFKLISLEKKNRSSNFMRCRSMNHRPKRVTLLQRFNGKTCIAIDEWHKTGPGKTTKPSGSNQFQSSFRLLIIQCWKSRAHTYVPSTHLVIWRIASETQLVDLSRCWSISNIPSAEYRSCFCQFCQFDWHWDEKFTIVFVFSCFAT